jgi:hypothetical protein
VIRLSFGDLTVAADADDPRHLGWLREFLVPDFRTEDHGEVDCSVLVVEDAARYRDALGGGPAEDAPLLECFALGSSVVRLPVLDEAGGRTRVADAQFDAVYEIEPASSRVVILTTPGNARVRASLLRVVREFAMNHSHGRGLFLHASAVATERGALVVAGPKAAGKTTLLTYLLSHGAGHYLSNDRVLVVEAEGGALLRNMPTVISVRPPTLELCPGFGERLMRSGFTSYLLTLDEARAREGEPVVTNQFGNYFLSPAQYRRLLDAPQRTEARPRALVFPVISERVETFEIEEIPREEILARLPDALLGAGDWRKGPEAFAIPGDRPAPDPADLESRAARFAASVRAYECRLGPDAYRDGALAAALVEHAAEAPPEGRAAGSRAQSV